MESPVHGASTKPNALRCCPALLTDGAPANSGACFSPVKPEEPPVFLILRHVARFQVCILCFSIFQHPTAAFEGRLRFCCPPTLTTLMGHSPPPPPPSSSLLNTLLWARHNPVLGHTSIWHVSCCTQHAAPIMVLALCACLSLRLASLSVSQSPHAGQHFSLSILPHQMHHCKARSATFFAC